MFKEVLLEDSIVLYTEYYHKALLKTIYHHPQFLLAEEKAEEYKIYLYIYEEDDSFVILPSVKRRINDITPFENLEEDYYDLITPHEYSGVISNEYNLELFEKLYEALKHHCIQNNIVFQFIRFNPYTDEYKAAKSINIRLSDRQNWVACTEEVLKSFQKRKAAYVRSAIKSGMYLQESLKTDEDIKVFLQYYTKAMDRLHAKKFLYFNYQYFEKLCKCQFTKLFFVKSKDGTEIFSGAIILCDNVNKKLYYHLVFKNYEKEKIHSMEFMIYTLSEWARKHGYSAIHLGGGSELLHRFKDSCTDKKVDYYTGSVVYNQKVYQLLTDLYCKTYPDLKDSQFLPIYRSNE